VERNIFFDTVNPYVRLINGIQMARTRVLVDSHVVDVINVNARDWPCHAVTRVTTCITIKRRLQQVIDHSLRHLHVSISNDYSVRRWRTAIIGFSIIRVFYSKIVRYREKNIKYPRECNEVLRNANGEKWCVKRYARWISDRKILKIK